MLDYDAMANESYEIAVGVYDGLTAGKDQVLPDEYIAKYGPIAKERATLAGHRLAYLIEKIFGNGAKTIQDFHGLQNFLQ